VPPDLEVHLVLDNLKTRKTQLIHDRGAFTSTASLETVIQSYIAETNANPKPFIWTKTADDILASVARFCLRTSNSDH
jgi:hypothetical protein